MAVGSGLAGWTAGKRRKTGEGYVERQQNGRPGDGRSLSFPSRSQRARGQGTVTGEEGRLPGHGPAEQGQDRPQDQVDDQPRLGQEHPQHHQLYL